MNAIKISRFLTVPLALLALFLAKQMPNEGKYYLELGIVLISLVILFWPVLKKRIDHNLSQNFSELYFIGYKILIVFLVLHFFPEIRTSQPSAPLPLIYFIDPHYLINYAGLITNVLQLSCVLFVLNIQPKFTSTIMLLAYIYFMTLDMSYGKIGNASHITSLLLLGICTSYWFFPLKQIKNIIFSFSFFIISFYYFLAFFAKVHDSPNLSWINSYAFSLWILTKEYDHWGWSGIFDLNFLQKLIVENRYFTFILSASAIATEMMGATVFFMPKWIRSAILFSLLGLHIGIYYTMHILFIQNIYVLLYLAVDWFAVFYLILIKLQKLLPKQLQKAFGKHLMHPRTIKFLTGTENQKGK